MGFFREKYHPNAYLQRVRNVKTGLETRTKILGFIERQPVQARKLGFYTSLSYSTVMYHLRRLEAEETVVRKGQRPCVWVLTGLGQKRLLG